MKYILAFITAVLITACSNSQHKNSQTGKTAENNNSTVKKEVNKTVKKPKVKIKTVNIGDLNLTFKNGKLLYPPEKTVILFENNNTYSKIQEMVLDKLNVKYYKTGSEFLQNYFNINTYPTIVVLENNKTVKYENFTPYEILKAEGF